MPDNNIFNITIKFYLQNPQLFRTANCKGHLDDSVSELQHIMQ